MGWTSGSSIMSEIIETVENLVPNFNTRKEMYKRFIEIFENEDCDTLEECLDDSLAYKEAFQEVHPTYGDDDFYEEDQD